jgi:outer membrane biosynthesis protein TonB
MALLVFRQLAAEFSASCQSASRLPAAKLALAVTVGLAVATAVSAQAQDPAPSTPAQAAPAQPAQADVPQQTSAQQVPAAANTPLAQAESSRSSPSGSDSILESELRTLLVGKPLFLRGCYLSDDLQFNERGGLYGASPRGSFTLSGVQIERLRLTKKDLILEGDRYGYRFLGALPGNNPTDDMERIKITPKKKVLRIRIERELVIVPKKEQGKPAKAHPSQVGAASTPKGSAEAHAVSASAATAAGASAATAQPPTGAAATGSAKSEPLKDEQTTTSPEHAVQRLKDALARLFTPSLDDRFVASMPDFWQLYYKSLAAKVDYQPSDSSVLHQNQVDKKASLVTAIDPPSNEYAQNYGVTGMALYHVVVGPDGKPGEIAVGHPIGFGLDENAVETLKKATFEPAIKDGKPVPVVLNLVVQFHISSNLTSEKAKPGQDTKPSLPGPYSLPTKP